MELTKEALVEIAKAIATETAKAVKAELEPLTRKFTPAAGVNAEGENIEGSRIVVGSTGEERLANDPKGGYRHFSEFARDVYQACIRNGRPSPKLDAWCEALRVVTGGAEKALSEADDASGGYLVPIEFANQLLMESLEASIVRPRATQIPMSSSVIKIPIVKDADHSSNYFGGVIIYRPAEGDTITGTSPKFGQISLNLHELAGLAKVSNTLLEDSPISLGPLLTRQFSEAIAFVEDDDFLQGDGANKALGMFHTKNPALITVDGETGQTADTVIYENIVKMWARLWAPCQRNAIWIANNDVFPQLALMKLDVGTGGAPVWLPNMGAAGTPNGTLMGRPLVLTEKMATLGDAGDIGLADMKRYFIGEKSGGVQVATSIHVYFVTDQTAFRFILRYDGQPAWANTITPKRSTTTLSPFIRLAART